MTMMMNNPLHKCILFMQLPGFRDFFGLDLTTVAVGSSSGWEENKIINMQTEDHLKGQIPSQ